MEVVTTKAEAEVQCEIIKLLSVFRCSMPLCSSECVGDCSNGHQKGLNYSPKSLFRPDNLVEEEAEEENKSNNFNAKLSR